MRFQSPADLVCPDCAPEQLNYVEIMGRVSALACSACGGFWLPQGKINSFRDLVVKKTEAPSAEEPVQEEIEKRPLFLFLDPELASHFSEWGPLALLGLGALLLISPLAFILEKSINTRFHEAGHALLAWLDSRPATPVGLIIPAFGWTNIEEPSLRVGLLILFLMGQGLYRSYRSRSAFLLATFCLLIFGWIVFSCFIPNKQSLMWFCWAGIGGEFLLSTWLLLGFYFYFPEKLHWPFFRWVLGVAGAFGLSYSLKKWYFIYRGWEPLPLGTAWGGSDDAGGDLNRLIEDYFWTAKEIVSSYLRLGICCLSALVITHLGVNLKKRLWVIAFIPILAFSRTDQPLEKLEGDRFQIDLKYRTENNFLKKNVYAPFKLKDCFLRKEMIAALNRMVEPLKKERLKLVIWDCYRPLEVQKAMWKLVPDPRYVADPKVGSNHNRGAAIDLALMSEDGILLRFPTGFDDFSKKAHADYACSQEERELCENRDKLKKMMLEVGLQVFPTEWWHFQLPSAEQLPLIKSFEATK